LQPQARRLLKILINYGRLGTRGVEFGNSHAQHGDDPNNEQGGYDGDARIAQDWSPSEAELAALLEDELRKAS
jgi:hypothetical protein